MLLVCKNRHLKGNNHMKTYKFPTTVAVLVLCAMAASLSAQVPSVVSYQGHLQAGGTNFHGAGLFKFALIDRGTNVSRRATANAVVTSGFITSYVVTDGGAGYTTAPLVTITDATGSGAVALEPVRSEEHTSELQSQR